MANYGFLKQLLVVFPPRQAPIFALVAFFAILLFRALPAQQPNLQAWIVGCVLLLIFVGSGLLLWLNVSKTSVASLFSDRERAIAVQMIALEKPDRHISRYLSRVSQQSVLDLLGKIAL
jgi:hypothetical protein